MCCKTDLAGSALPHSLNRNKIIVQQHALVLPAANASGVSPEPTQTSSAAQAWAALAPLLAGQPRIRLSRDGGKTYPQKHERALTETLPTFPAAVRIFGKDGSCSAIFLDFDSSIAGIDWVEADVKSLQSWLHSCGARWIEDHSPNGGRHVYIPLEKRVAFSEARDVVEALGTRYRTLDKSPHQNLLHGCMRTPGSPHKRGGHQELAMSLSMAYDVARRPNKVRVWEAIREDLGPEIAGVRALRLERPLSAENEGLEAPQVIGRMSRPMQQMALSGLYDANRYASDSEARQAVLTAAAAAGMSLVDVQRRVLQGVWPGLASFYARYASRHRLPSLKRDWNNAVSYLRKNQGARSGNNNARKSPTSQPNTQPPLGTASSPSSSSEHRYLRSWRNALSLREPTYAIQRNGLARRMVLRALGAAAHMTGSRFVEFGDRSIAVATGLDHTTVGSHLRALRSEKDPLVTLVERGRGTKGDLYMLTIPEGLRAVAEDLTWRKGKIHALRPVFRELGLPAAFVYEALERTPGLSTTELVSQTKLSRTAVSESLEVLAAWNMVVRNGGRSWMIVATTSLQELAECFGVLESVAGQLQRYRVERIVWREWLSRNVNTVAELLSPTDDYPWEAFEGPPDEWTLADMAFRRGL
ncbi:MarR family transcriptional regulator [Paenarthrobacter aromaticivorans]|uniref:MarR family transcriptional regulator n=1 Tax=Paenarthrobacter aromaticivorans TaxID=2849150 RepID=A0ABS6I822_9MICC|nr:MarR family transcriptional regulator [Paenarthrobacter sp. MMS21-TAE1-1]MBU8867870.1 MarR family transcriptional regulator [Paenarthrobacter sp. MMS21-TAE1-1]